MKRYIAIAALPMILGGCLPLPVTIVSTAISGISYLKTGKSSTDHVLSAAIERDCALTRPIMGQEVCQDIDPESAAASERVLVAAYPGDRDGGSFRSFRDPELMLGAMKIDVPLDEPTVIAAALPMPAPKQAPIETPGLARTDEPSLLGLAGKQSAEFSTVPVPLARPAIHEKVSVQPVLRTSISVSAPIDSWTPPAGYKRRNASVEPSAPVEPTARVDTGIVGEGRYVVIGSLRDTSRAEALAERFGDRQPEIRRIEVSGQVWNRVVVGPLESKEALALRTELGMVDGVRPWIAQMAAPLSPTVDLVAMR